MAAIPKASHSRTDQPGELGDGTYMKKFINWVIDPVDDYLPDMVFFSGAIPIHRRDTALEFRNRGLGRSHQFPCSGSGCHPDASCDAGLDQSFHPTRAGNSTGSGAAHQQRLATQVKKSRSLCL
jgi:hypothetical protein